MAMVCNRVSVLVFSSLLIVFLIIFFLANDLLLVIFRSGIFEMALLHSAIEAVGALSAIVTAIFLLQQERNSALNAVPVAVGLLGMAILDSFHAMVSPGNTFILLRSLAGLFGALGFMLVWVPENSRRPVFFWTRLLPIGAAALAIALSVGILLSPDAVPQMIRDGKFAPININLHYVIGALFLASVPPFILDLRRSHRLDTLLFACMGLLFGLAALMFPQSSLWNSLWWLWHLQRLVVYAALFWLINYRHRELVSDLQLSLEERSRIETKLLDLNIHLEKRVAESIAELKGELADRMLAQEAMKRIQKRLTRAQAIARIGDWERDLITNTLVWSDEMYRLVGMEPGDPEGTYANFLAMIHPEDRKRVKTLSAAAAHEGKPYAVEYRLHREKDGVDLVIRAIGDVVCDQQGKPCSLVGTAQDITELKQTEEQLSFTQFSVENLGDPIFWVNREGRFIYVNVAACRRLGYTQEELLRLSVADINPQFPIENWESRWNQLKENKVLRFETVHQSKGGEVYPAEVTASYMTYGDKEIICSFVRDVSERKWSEKVLSESQDRLRTIIEAEPECVKLLDAQGRLLEMNPAGLRMIEADSFDQVRGQCVYNIVVERDRDAFATVIEQVFQGQEKTLQFEIEGLKGGHKFLDTNAVPLYDPQDKQKIIALLAVTRDITELKRAEIVLSETNAELKRSNRDLGDFSYIVSHDMKEPLRGMQAFSRFLLEDYAEKLDAEGVRYLQQIIALGEHGSKLIEDVLYFSRLGHAELAIQNADPNAVVADIEKTLGFMLKEKNARILVPQPMPHIVCDNPGLTEVLRNLITNAIKYNNKAEKTVEIGMLEHVQAPQGPEKNVFYVKDNGIGIDPQFRQDIFNIFKRLATSASFDPRGTGAGLTFVKKIVERNGCNIWFESEPGKGSIFYFTIEKK